MIPRLLQIFRSVDRALGAYRWHMLLLVVLGFLSGAFEVVGVGVLIPLFSYAIQKNALGSDVFSSAVQWLFSLLHISVSVRALLILIVGLFVLKAIVLLAFSYIKVWIVANYEYSMRSKLYADMLHTRWPHLIHQKIGYVENVLMTDLGTVITLIKQSSALILVLTGLTLFLVTALHISALVTLTMLAVGIAVFFLTRPLIRRTRDLAKVQTKLNKHIAHFVNEQTAGLKLIKAFSVEPSVAHAADSFFLRLKENRIRLFFTRDLVTVLNAPVGVIFICVMFAISYLQPGFNFASFITIVYLVNRTFDYMGNVQSSLQTMNESLPALQNVMRLQKDAELHQEERDGNEPFRFEKDLRFDQVSFSYLDGESVLERMDFTIQKGNMVGIVGPSGAGKTTVVDLLLRLFDPKEGHIVVDGCDIRDIRLEDWRKNIGYVSQEIFLQNDTVAHNISFYQDLTQEEIETAAKKAKIHEVITSLPQGYETTIGERGSFLSGGQRQRLVLARVLARKPKILILDEATSSLDNESELLIQKSIEQLKGEVTVIAIAHRLSTVMSSDMLLVIEKGRVVERGSPQALLADKDSAFFKLAHIRE